MSIKTADVEIVSCGFRIYTSVFKTLGPGGLPCGFIKLSKLPSLYNICRYYVENTKTPLLFDNVGSMKPFEVTQQALKRVCNL